ncbi:Hsp33 family molecular chaperone HslO [Bartonella sp. DGB1]|uniref:Hsp33 family molecular chaperone HslO n=1 Tax=Bartonella sp. DGB1 TaxID=3239807 RepID=UPI00352622A0
MTNNNNVNSQIKLSNSDSIYSFSLPSLNVRGKIVQLDKILDDILTRHNYPQAVNNLIAEIATLTSLLGATLKFTGKLTIQIRSEGAVNLVICDFLSPNKIRAYARFNQEMLDEANTKNKLKSHELLGQGTLAITLTSNTNNKSYQGLIALDGSSLEEIAKNYFIHSEQIPTYIRLAIKPKNEQQQLRAGGIFLQYMPNNSNQSDYASNSKELWQEAETFAKTASDEELTDPNLSAERLLYRLFNEYEIELFNPPLKLKFECSCSKTYIENLLKTFNKAEIDQSIENNKITVTCDFCAETYEFDPKDF